MEEWLRFTFTLTDPTNHGLAVANLRLTRQGYRERARHTLAAIRAALRELDRRNLFRRILP